MLSNGPRVFLNGFFSLQRKEQLKKGLGESFRNHPVHVIPSNLYKEPTPYTLKTQVTNFCFALCPGTAEINTAFLQEPALDFPRSSPSSYRPARSSRLGSPLRPDQEHPGSRSSSASFLEGAWTISATEKLSVHSIMAFVIRSPRLDCSTPENSPPKAFEIG